VRSLLFVSLLVLPLAACPGDDDAPPVGRDGGADAGSPSADGGGEGDDAATPSGPRVEIGTGITSFVPVADGEDVELVMGPQGGWHIDVTLRLYEMDPMDMRLNIDGYDADTGEMLALPIERILTTRRVREEDDHWLRLGEQLVLGIASPAEAVGKDVRIVVRAMPVEGEGASAEKTVHVIDEE